MPPQQKPLTFFNKITIFIIASSLIATVIIFRLFQLQVLAHEHFQNLATTSQYGYIELPAQRGEILIKDYHSNEEFPLATNISLNLIYADPVLIKDPALIADTLAPLLFNIEEERAADDERINKTKKDLSKAAAELTPEEIDKLLKPYNDDELKSNFKTNLLKDISAKKRPEILLATELSPEKIQQLEALNLPGTKIVDTKLYVYPPEISAIESTSQTLAPLVEIPSKKLQTILKGQNRYVVLKRKLHPETTEKIKKIINEDKEKRFTGIGLVEEYFRYYPEETLGANVIGYVNRENVGQYGIESSFNNQLQGQAGKLQTKKDSIGRQITVGESTLQSAVDGDDIVLTIDRSIQLKVEKILEKKVKEYQADSGQVVIMNPKTGAIVAMAHYPTFNPNIYGEVFKKVEINLTPEDVSKLYPTNDAGVYYFYVNEITLDRYSVFEEKDENGKIHYYRYENFRGPEVYHNKIVSWPYEPGSVFKPIVMAIGIDDGDVTPNTTYNDNGPIGVDWNVYSEKYDFEIKNSTGQYYGLVDMKTVLAKSLNTGMTFISKKIGPSLFYSYLEKFGFLDRTDIEFEQEVTGKVEYFEDWTESELATHAFGQGMTITMIQLANAYSAIANGGVLMQPYIIDEIRHDDGTSTKTEPHKIRRVISEEAAAKMTAMLVYSGEYGYAKAAGVENYYMAGKTGTAQTYKHGQALTATGTTIASFAGYAPIDDPQFIGIVKFDHPRTNQWGDQTAAPTFSEIAAYLFDYYNIPPDKS